MEEKVVNQTQGFISGTLSLIHFSKEKGDEGNLKS